MLAAPRRGGLRTTVWVEVGECRSGCCRLPPAGSAPAPGRPDGSPGAGDAVGRNGRCLLSGASGRPLGGNLSGESVRPAARPAGAGTDGPPLLVFSLPAGVPLRDRGPRGRAGPLAWGVRLLGPCAAPLGGPLSAGFSTASSGPASPGPGPTRPRRSPPSRRVSGNLCRESSAGPGGRRAGARPGPAAGSPGRAGSGCISFVFLCSGPSPHWPCRARVPSPPI